MPASDSTEALRPALAKVFCAIGVSVDHYTALRERALAGPIENFSNAAIAGNSVVFGNLSLTINNNPPQQFEVQLIADKLDELINTLRR